MDFTDSQGPADVGPADAGLADARPADARPADARPADAGQEASVGLAAFRRQRRRNKRARWAALNAAVLGAGVAVVLFLTQFGFQFYRVPSGSMEPTLVIGDRIWVQRVGLDTAKLHAGDIVVFRRPPADHVDTSISDVVKRIVATPGERVSSAAGHLLVDGKVVPESFLPKATITANVATQVVPAGDYFVMGDNRTDSYDSRSFGPIPSKLIVGRVIAQLWPPSKLELF